MAADDYLVTGAIRQEQLMPKGHSTYDFPAGDGYQTTGVSETFPRQIGTFIGIFILVLVALAGLALATWNAADPSLSYATGNRVTNILGFWGAAYADLTMQFLGLASVVALLPPFFWGILLTFQRNIPRFPRRFFFWVLGVIFFSLAAAVLSAPPSWPMPIGLGGIVGDRMLGLCDVFLDRFPRSITGPAIVILFIPLALAISAYAGGAIGRRAPEARPLYSDSDMAEADDLQSDEEAEQHGADNAAGAGRLVTFSGWLMHMVMRLFSFFQRPGRQHTSDDGLFPVRAAGKKIEPHFSGNSALSTAPAGGEPQQGAAGRGPLSRISAVSKPSKTAAKRNGFELPHTGYLSVPKKIPHEETLTRKTLSKNAQTLAAVLEDFGVKGDIINAYPGPVVTLYELEPAPGVKSARIIGLADDIARSMSAVSARIAVIPGRNAIGIELPNPTRETVYLREMLEARTFRESKAKLGLTLGKTIGGEAVIADLSKMPHVLVAGTTGSGKSVAINTMIMSLVYRMTPEECRLIMVDPKMLELSVYEGIPHLLTPVVTDPKKAIVALKWAVREMEDRYRKMAKIGVRNIDSFNNRVKDARQRNENLSRTVQTGFNKETGEPVFETEEFELAPIPYIVVIIDEMADLMIVAGKDIEGAVQRLAQMARAAGIHVIMATQRPSVDVITGTIKANFPTRISFAVTSKIDSRTILGDQGAEQLLGQGDMLFMMGGGRIQRVHGPFVGDSEVEKVVAHLKTQGVPEYLSAVMEEVDEGDCDNSTADGDSSDDLYDQAVTVVLRDRKVSTSYIQRRLGIGYNRAATIIERMEEKGLISAANHAGKREILDHESDL